VYRQTKWIGHVLHHNLLLLEILSKAEYPVKDPSWRPHQKTLDWMTDKVNREMTSFLRWPYVFNMYGHLKKLTGRRMEGVVQRSCLWAKNLSKYVAGLP